MRDRDGGPAIEHAYSATTYQAQGATVDTAYVMADPSMTRQEFYVAASRSRDETRLYVTPEVQTDREEFAPRPKDIAGLGDIAKAAERDGAQAAAHDAALRPRFSEMASGQLAAHLREVRSEAHSEQRHEDRERRLSEEIRRDMEILEKIRAEPREPATAAAERSTLHRIELNHQEREGLPALGHEARAESAVIEAILAERERAAVVAARLSPADYITREIGERPSDPEKAREWDKAVRGIEGYRLREGVVDRDSALGPEPKHGYAERSEARESIERAQRALGMREHAVERSVGMDIGL